MLRHFISLLAALTIILTGISYADEKAQCLACHGPFDKFISTPLTIATESGEVNPHVTIPHDTQSEENFMTCVECHSIHAMPPPAGYKDASANIEYCYSCHHSYQFESCSKCH